MLDENSALGPNMPQRDDDQGGKPKRLSFSPASSVWGQMGRAWTSGDRNARTIEIVTAWDNVAFFHQFLGLTNYPALAPFANVPCKCQSKRVLTNAGKQRADLEILNIHSQVAQQIDLLVDVTLRHDFVGAGHNGLNQGQLRNPDKPDKLLDSAPLTRFDTIAPRQT